MNLLRTSILGAVCFLSVAVSPWPASANKSGTYVGHVFEARGSHVTFEVVKRTNGKLGVRDFEARNLPAECGSQTQTVNGYSLKGIVGFGLRVNRKGRFREFSSGSGFRDGDIFDLHGRLLRGGLAAGTVRVTGDIRRPGGL